MGQETAVLIQGTEEEKLQHEFVTCTANQPDVQQLVSTCNSGPGGDCCFFFQFVVRTRQGNKFRRHIFLGGLWSLGKKWGYYCGLQERGGGEILGFTMQQRGTYEHISGKAWKEWWANIFGNHALLLLLPIKQHASQLRKPKPKSSSVAPGRELCTTVKLLRKSERKN